MPNPPTLGARGPCHSCDCYGGIYEPNARFGDTICLDPKRSGKEVCRMPEIGCAAWRPKNPPAGYVVKVPQRAKPL